MNSVHLIGRLATDVEVKEVNGGSKVSSFILAVDRNAEEADFFRIKAWNSQAEAASRRPGPAASRSTHPCGAPPTRLSSRERESTNPWWGRLSLAARARCCAFASAAGMLDATGSSGPFPWCGHVDGYVGTVSDSRMRVSMSVMPGPRPSAALR